MTKRVSCRMVDDHSYSAITMGASFSKIVFYKSRILFMNIVNLYTKGWIRNGKKIYSSEISLINNSGWLIGPSFGLEWRLGVAEDSLWHVILTGLATDTSQWIILSLWLLQTYKKHFDKAYIFVGYLGSSDFSKNLVYTTWPCRKTHLGMILHNYSV